MTADELRAALEMELAWRQEELAFFKNQLNEIPENNKDRYRKSLVLILYSHMEGFIKICLQTYIQYINSQKLKRGDVNTELMVAGLYKEFIAYENLDRKCEFFRKELPEDSRLPVSYTHLWDRIQCFTSLASFAGNPWISSMSFDSLIVPMTICPTNWPSSV